MYSFCGYSIFHFIFIDSIIFIYSRRGRESMKNEKFSIETLNINKGQGALSIASD